MSSAFISPNRRPILSEPFIHLSTHFDTHPVSLEFIDLVVKSLMQSLKHLPTRLEKT